jgi:hypothetical protein
VSVLPVADGHGAAVDLEPPIRQRVGGFDDPPRVSLATLPLGRVTDGVRGSDYERLSSQVRQSQLLR